MTLYFLCILVVLLWNINMYISNNVSNHKRKLLEEENIQEFISGYNGYTYEECKAAVRENIMLNYNTFNNSLNYWLEQYNVTNENKKIVVFTLTDISYSENFSNWYDMTTTNNSFGVIVAMNHEACIYLKTMNKPYVCYEKTNNFRAIYEVHALSFTIALIKWIGMWVILDNNFDVILSEMDVFWRQNPIPELLQPSEYDKFDIQITQHCDYFPWSEVAIAETSHDIVNIGFIFAKRGSVASIFLRNLLHYIETFPNFFSPPGKNWPIDQVLFDSSLRYYNQYKDKFPAKKFYNQSDYIVHDIAYKKLPPARFLHNSGKIIKLAFDTKTVHLSWGIGASSKRIYCAYTLGIPIYNYTVPTEYEGTVCFQSTAVYDKPYEV